jgi:hypothetical protein
VHLELLDLLGVHAPLPSNDNAFSPPILAQVVRYLPPRAGHDGEMRRSAVLVGLLAVLVLGCSAADGGAGHEADATADRVGVVMSVHRDPTLADGARRIRNPEIEVLEATGTEFDGRLVIRVTHREEREVLEAASDVHVAVRCYRFDYSMEHRTPDPHRIDCPDGPATSLPPATTPVRLAPGAEDALRVGLSALSPAERIDVAALRRVGRAASPGADVTGAVVDGVGAVALSADGECVFGRAMPDSVEVWHVPRVVAQPGELGCGADSAARGEGKQSPH